ncbi:hypothetical protein [Zobellia sp. 1_MG-2023]|uniref:hypothetical protein n=1 Tax=Zobellia sp. 1_MG-2023 TaxID=3062626 RepID=UPI0026E139D6|nr:hypothetical protein [Zobellia sp. 1_MG-2023]MDO6818264.1 hypothetical protein [Zobellia sp. 1_MG-2023]
MKTFNLTSYLISLGNLLLKVVLVALLIALFTSCNPQQKAKSDIEISFTPDTLNVGYTYWWEESGPFIGYCGKEYALVFSGTVVDLKKANHDAAPLYISQKGTIALDEVYKIKEMGTNSYASQKYFTTDCFNHTDVTVGDKVLVFCYDYEGELVIPGNNSILNIKGLDHPLVGATKRFIDADENPIEIKEDSTLWSAYGYRQQLKQMIRCRENTERIISK